jgi:hypothetical protein
VDVAAWRRNRHFVRISANVLLATSVEMSMKVVKSVTKGGCSTTLLNLNVLDCKKSLFSAMLARATISVVMASYPGSASK